MCTGNSEHPPNDSFLEELCTQMRKSKARARHTITGLTVEDSLFARFLRRQSAPVLPPKSLPRFAEREISGIYHAVCRIRDAVQNSFFLESEKEEALKVLDRLKQVLPKRIRGGIKYHKMVTGYRQGRPLADLRKYFLLAALVPYSKATKGRGAWRWVDQMLAEAGSSGAQGSDETWRRSIKDRMAGKMTTVTMATDVHGGEECMEVLASTNSDEFDAIMSTGACAHLMFMMCQKKRLKPGTLIRGPLLRAMDRSLEAKPIEKSEEAILRQAASLMPGLLDPFDDAEMIPLSAVWKREWIA